MTNNEQSVPQVPMRLLPDRFAIGKLPPTGPIPDAPRDAAIWSLTITSRERSLVCAEADMPEGIEVDAGWRAFYLEGWLPFDLAGILLSVIAPISTHGLGVFVLSTFDSDLVLVRAALLDTAIAYLQAAGHAMLPSE